VDQNALWAETDVGIISVLDSNGGLDVADAASKLCKLASSNCVLGLPHVLRTVSKEGICAAEYERLHRPHELVV